MTNRYAVRLEQLEALSHVAAAEQTQAQAEPRRPAPLVDGPAPHPGNGATAGDADGD